MNDTKVICIKKADADKLNRFTASAFLHESVYMHSFRYFATALLSFFHENQTYKWQ